MVDAVLSSRRVDPEKVTLLREHFESLAADRELVERALDAEGRHAEAAFLRETEDGPVLYYYTERAEDPDVPEEFDEAVRELGERHAAALEDACVEPARDEDGDLRRFETLFFASPLDRPD
jgi:hypothetical protein